MWIKENKTFIKMVMKVIPSYCKGYKKEYIYLLEINKKCKNLLEIIETEEVFSSYKAKKLIIGFNKYILLKEFGHFKDNKDFCVEEEDIKYCLYLEKKLLERLDAYFSEVNYQFDEERYQNDSTGFRLFFETFTKFMDEIKVKESVCTYVFSDSDSDSD